MIAQFKTQDDAVWSVDTDRLSWSRDEKIEEGNLTPRGSNVWALSPRTVKSEGPGQGLSVVGFQLLVQGDTLYIFMRADVPTHDFTLQEAVTAVKYETIHLPNEVAEEAKNEKETEAKSAS